jgi:hypothetical protein
MDASLVLRKQLDESTRVVGFQRAFPGDNPSEWWGSWKSMPDMTATSFLRPTGELTTENRKVGQFAAGQIRGNVRAGHLAAGANILPHLVNSGCRNEFRQALGIVTRNSPIFRGQRQPRRADI